MVACMDFSFIGGSMGNVMGEKIARSVEFAIEKMSIYVNFKIWRSKNDGGRHIFNANGKSYSKTHSFLKPITLYFLFN